MVNNWITSITSPYNKIIRKATGFSGTVANFYPWPVSSVVTRVTCAGATVLNTGPLLGTIVGAMSQPTPQTGGYPSEPAPIFNPERISLDRAYNGEYSSSTGVYIFNPSNIPYLRLDFGQNVGPMDIYVEGYAVGNKFNITGDTVRVTKAPFSRIFSGTSTAITAFLKNITPPAFRPTSNTTTALADAAIVTLTGNTYLYISSSKTFSGFQINLGSESYTRTKAYTLEYWNGTAWTGLSGIASTTSAWSSTDVVFHQSGVITFTKPSDWATTKVTGDPETTLLADTDINLRTNYTFSDSQFFIRIVPPSPNAETVPVIGVSIFD